MCQDAREADAHLPGADLERRGINQRGVDHVSEVQEPEAVLGTGEGLGDVEVTREIHLEKGAQDILCTVVDVMILEKGGGKDREVIL